ncbi:hypothetical protein V1525DRAFT_409183 [Lipomyces kononenkoae]|uniref:Uncharacterized protein n=1 Tax=Lipomyces kononenkoae TaxID=34357 RepID=A0ACC3SVR9_LIPKO
MLSMTSQKYLPIYDDNLAVDSSLGTSHSVRRFSRLGYVAIAVLLSSLLAGFLGAVIAMHEVTLGPEVPCDSSGLGSRRYNGRAHPAAINSAGSNGDSMQKRALVDEGTSQALLNATAAGEDLLGSVLPPLIPLADATSRNETLLASNESANIATPVVKKSLVSRTLEDDVLETLGNATAVAANLLEVLLPALIARTDIRSVNGTVAAGYKAKAGIPDIAGPIVTRDLITSASGLGDDVLQTLLNATAVAGQLLGAVVPALVTSTDPSILSKTFVVSGVPKSGIPDVGTSIVQRDLITSASGLVTSASALGGDVLQTLLNATAVAGQLLGTVIPALVASAEDRTLNSTTIAGGVGSKAVIQDIAGPTVRSDPASALGDDVLLTLLNATAVAEQLLGVVIPALASRTNASSNGTVH